MKLFIKLLFGLTLTFSLFGKNETEDSLPASEVKETLPMVNNQKTEENDDSIPDSLSTTDIDPITEETSNSEETSEEKPLEDIRDIRPAVDLPMETWQTIVLLCIVITLLLGLIYTLIKRRKKHQTFSIVPPDPYHKALQELETALQLIQRLDQRPFATGITDAVRGYLAAVFNLPAPECTTEEVLEQLPNVALLTEDIRQNITYLLQQCDLAKFTKLQFEQPDRLKLYHQAKDFIQSSDKIIQLQNANKPEQ